MLGKTTLATASLARRAWAEPVCASGPAWLRRLAASSAADDSTVESTVEIDGAEAGTVPKIAKLTEGKNMRQRNHDAETVRFSCPQAA
jgi:hypothetical protein